MTEVDVLDTSAIDLEAYVRLQKAAFAHLLQNANVSDGYMTPEYYAWKYRPPSGSAKIAVVRESGDLAAVTAMLPIQLQVASTLASGWHICDVATRPESRGKGHFQSCLNALTNAPEADSVFFAFPNGNSKRGFDKIGWKVLHKVTTWLNPWTTWAAADVPSVREIDRFEADRDTLAARIAKKDQVSIRHSAAYLNWRYCDHPIHEYACFVHDENDGTSGFAVVRLVRAMGRDIAVAMELRGESNTIELRLLRQIAAWARGRKLAQMVLLDTAMPPANALTAGFIPVPTFVLPKKQLLMAGAPSGAKAETMIAMRWRVQTGDWDAF